MTNHGLSLTVYLWAVSIYRDGATPESGIELRVLNSLSSMPNTQQALQLKKDFSYFGQCCSSSLGRKKLQIPTRKPEKIVVALFSGILVNSGILVAGISRLHTSKYESYINAGFYIGPFLSFEWLFASFFLRFTYSLSWSFMSIKTIFGLSVAIKLPKHWVLPVVIEFFPWVFNFFHLEFFEKSKLQAWIDDSRLTRQTQVLLKPK